MSGKTYSYGFLFSEKVVKNVPSGFIRETILNKYSYYHKGDTQKLIYEDSGHFIIIHGEFMHISVDDKIANDKLIEKLLHYYSNSYDEFLNLLDFLAGRYVILIGNQNYVNIYPDATNSRSTYYINNEINISSHASLLNDVYNLGSSNVLTNFHNTLLNTPFKNVKSVLPNFTFELPSGKIQRFFPREENKFTHLSENLKFKLIERFWCEQLKKVFENSNNVFLTITGGGDSRMSLALAHKYLDRLKLITYAYTDSKSIDKSDITSEVLSLDNIIVKKMLSNLKLNHKFLYFDTDETLLTAEERSVLRKNSIALHSTFFIPFIKNNFDVEKLVHIRANLLEIGQARYHNTYKESSLENVYKRYMLKNKQYIKDNIMRDRVSVMFNDFIHETDYGNSTFDYHLLDLMYWEIHMGRWHCEILNTHDYVVETVSPYNHRALIDITLSFEYIKRKNRYFQYELINRNFPVLNFFGMNEVENLYESKIRKSLIGENRDEQYD